MLPDVRYTLSSDLHIPGVKVRTGDREEMVKIHKIPNARFGEIGDSFLIRIFMPGLIDDAGRDARQQKNYIGERELKLFYNMAVRQAASNVLPDNLVREWPAVFDSEQFRSTIINRGAAGHTQDEDEEHEPAGPTRFQQTAREIYGHLFNNFLDELRRLVDEYEELSFARGFFLGVEAKNLKRVNESAHPPPDEALVGEDGRLIDAENPRTMAIKKLLSDFNMRHMKVGEWFVDIATTISAKHQDQPVSLFPNYLYHPEIMNHFTGVPVPLCAQWVRTNSGGYVKDEDSHLGDIAGFRVVLREYGDHTVCYLQIYTSNKSLTYHLHGKQKAKRTHPYRVIENWRAERDDYSGRLVLPFQDALAAASETHDVAVRIESRHELHSYPYVHLMLPAQHILRWFLWLPNTVYWGYKYRRLVSITNTLDRVLNTPARATITAHRLPEAASLVILMTYMTNALVNRPDDGGHWDEVRDAGCVHVEKDGTVVPARPLKIFYIHSLRLPNPQTIFARISSQRTISQTTILYLCTPKTRRTLVHAVQLFRGTYHDPQRDLMSDDEEHEPTNLIGAPRISNRQQRVAISLLDEVDDMFADVIANNQPVERYDSEEEDPEEREALPLPSVALTNLVATFPLQVFAKVPNKKNGGSWCTLDAVARYEITYDLFRDSNRPFEVFTSFMDCGHDILRWDKTVRAWFPMVNEKHSFDKVQGLKNLSVWQDWESTLVTLPLGEANDIVKEIRKRINTQWRWLPWMTKNHLWATGTTSSGTHRGNTGEAGGPWIIFNPRYRAIRAR
ncbi:hypothetical protein RSAG8_11595, partial [Rhizoctonia solani AG-8 WAC10335]